MKLGVVVFNGLYQSVNKDAAFKFLPNLAAERILGCFMGLNLSARKFPVAFPLAGGALGGKDESCIVVYDGSNDSDFFS